MDKFEEAKFAIVGCFGGGLGAANLRKLSNQMQKGHSEASKLQNPTKLTQQTHKVTRHLFRAHRQQLRKDYRLLPSFVA
jgi:hypothetical protein